MFEVTSKARAIIGTATPGKRMARLAVLALTLSTTLSTLAPSDVVAREAANTGVTEAQCWNPTGFGSGRRIQGWHPTGSTDGITYLAARVQSTVTSTSPVYSRAWAVMDTNGSYWIKTDATRFPNGQFYAGAWYRSTLIDYAHANYPYHRVQWLIQYADGAQVYRYSAWRMC